MERKNIAPHFLSDVLMSHIQNQPCAIAYTFLSNGGKDEESITYGELDRRVRALAEILYQKNLTEERVILLYPTSLDFIVAFLACLYAGVVAIPINSFNKEQSNKYLPLVQMIIKDATVKAIVTTDVVAELMRRELSIDEQKVEIIHTDLICAKDEISKFIPISVSTSMLSHLQYTSGSTSTPRGVISNHKNLAHSLFETAKIWQYTSQSVSVTWAPHAHVYGLTAGLLVPLYSGARAILMTPSDFLINPISWLKAISNFKATHSGCPNFGYEFCVEQIEEEELKELDLSSWRVATNGGESVRLTTLMNFFNKFKSYGFSFERFHPAYGMSECTGLIATSKMITGPLFCFVEKEALHFNRVVEVEIPEKASKEDIKTQALVSCGAPINGFVTKIVNPDTRLEVASDSIGEVWLRGPMCSQGYWNASDSHLSMLECGDTNYYIRTGDLGFIKQGELFLVGRLKELIIIYGKNHYPIDIEMDVKKSHIRFSKNMCVVFSTVVDNKEELFVLQEIEDNLSKQEYETAVTSVRRVLSLNHGIDAYAIVLVVLHSIPKTGSGKLQRSLASQKYFNQEFHILYESIKALA